MPLSRACLHHHLSYLTPCELRWPLTPKWCSYRIRWHQVQLRREGPKLMGCCCSGEKISSQMLQVCGHTCWPTHTRQDMRASRKLYTGGGPPSIVHKPINAYGSSCGAVLCVVCQRNKFGQLHPTGLLHPLPVPSAIWSDISMDFVEGFLNVAGKSVVLTVVDRF
jgi:hypothetical protein